MKCFICEEEVREDERFIEDDVVLCEECARKQANRIYDKLYRFFEEEETIFRKAFLTFGWDDLAYVLDEEKENG